MSRAFDEAALRAAMNEVLNYPLPEVVLVSKDAFRSIQRVQTNRIKDAREYVRRLPPCR